MIIKGKISNRMDTTPLYPSPSRPNTIVENSCPQRKLSRAPRPHEPNLAILAGSPRSNGLEGGRRAGGAAEGELFAVGGADHGAGGSACSG